MSVAGEGRRIVASTIGDSRSNHNHLRLTRIMRSLERSTFGRMP